MPIFHQQNVLNGGEISPLLRARIDQPRYNTGEQELFNFVCMPQGGITRRPGIRYLGHAQTRAARLIPFVFSSTQGRILEFGDRTLRVWMPTGQRVDKVFESPFAGEDLQGLRHAQSADVIYFAHHNYKPCKLSRYADDDWRFSYPTFMPTIGTPQITSLSTIGSSDSEHSTDYQYKVSAIDEETGQESLPSDVKTINAKALNSVDYYIRIAWTRVEGASYYRVYKNKMGIFGYIGRSEGLYYDDKNIGADTEDAPLTYKNPFDGEGNYPSQVFFHQQRLGFASSLQKPVTIWMSRTGEFESFATSTPPKDDDFIEATLAATEANRILWLLPDRQALTFGTEGSEWTLQSADGVALTPASISFQLQTTIGSAEGVGALSVSGGILYVQRGSSAIRQFAYNYSADKYLGQDVTILARHILQDREVLAWAYQQEPHSILWCVLSDGGVAALTYMPEQEILGWHQHRTAGSFVDVATIPGLPDDQIWFLTDRDGCLQVERLETFFSGDDLGEAYFLDNALAYRGSPIRELAGLEHLGGRSDVVAFVDGGMLENLVVSENGECTLPRAGSSIVIGLPYESRMIPNLPEVQTQSGTSLMHNRKILSARVRVYQSMSFLAGILRKKGKSTFYTIIDRNIDNNSISIYPAFDDQVIDLDIENCGGWTSQNILQLSVSTPTPLTVLALGTTLEIAPFMGGAKL